MMAFCSEDIKSLCEDLPAAVVERHVGRLPEEYRQRFDAEHAARHLRLIAGLSGQNPVTVVVEPMDGAGRPEVEASEKPSGPVEPESPLALESDSASGSRSPGDRDSASAGPAQPSTTRAICTVIAFDHPFEFSLITGVLAGCGFNIQAGDVYTLEATYDQPEFRQGLHTAHAGGGGPESAKGRGSVGRGPRSHRRGGRARFRHRAQPAAPDPHKVPVIVDQFIGSPIGADDTETFEAWAQHIGSTITEVITLLAKREDNSARQAKRLVNERVTDRLASLPPGDEAGLMPVDLNIDPIEHGAIRLTITAQDTPAFLYSLTTALSLQGMSIERVRIETDNAMPQTITDEIDLVRTHRGGFDQTMLERIKVSALLTKQFTYFLDQSPDPFAALERFEELTEQILTASPGPFQAGQAEASKSADEGPAPAGRASTQGEQGGRAERAESNVRPALSNSTKPATDWMTWLMRPEAMRNLAKLLGTSDYLWEDFIRGQYESLQPILTLEGPERRFSEPPQTLARRLELALEGAVGLAEQRDRLNRFKDREIFSLDLDHILNPAIGFRQFSEELTALAEHLISAATRLVYDDLVGYYGPPIRSKPTLSRIDNVRRGLFGRRQHSGQTTITHHPKHPEKAHEDEHEPDHAQTPTNDDAPSAKSAHGASNVSDELHPGHEQARDEHAARGRAHASQPTHADDAERQVVSRPSASDLPYAIFGLGKLGGVALGYASDIELIFVHDARPRDHTAGARRGPISCTEFFEQLAQESSRFIRTRRAGIFETDLRLRPYGKDGPLASSVDLFSDYYGPKGQAHPFEKLALVRLRWIAGNPELGYRVEKLRNRYVYDHAGDVLDLDSLWDIWSRAKQEKLGGPAARGESQSLSAINAKYSPGALVDLEGTVQLLQVMHASAAPQLRVPRLSQAMEALQRAGVFSPAEYAQLRDAYDFLRQLINALRMLRGDAKDLFLPEANSLELTHLARRMNYTARRPGSNDAAADLLIDDFKRHTQAVQQFIQTHFDRPCPGLTP